MRLLKALSTLGPPAIFYPNFAKRLGSIEAGIFLSFLIQNDGFVPANSKVIHDSTGLTPDEQEKALQTLRVHNLVGEEQLGNMARYTLLGGKEGFSMEVNP